MRITDDRYQGEIEKFNLAIRMIRHEARTGTIRNFTGFTEDRIRKLYGAYFKSGSNLTVRRRRGKSPRQINRFVSSTRRHTEATLLACLLRHYRAIRFDQQRKPVPINKLEKITLGNRLCHAFESYATLYADPEFNFEWTWNLYHALVESQELLFSQCSTCGGSYVQDAFALDYHWCPLCEQKQLLRNNCQLNDHNRELG
ncbi:MAG: FlhC family transcriptional regulator [Gammaproteobacteria bacterium]|nr:FlhC family transcriptional regulator [Gammaproteobacteria bacterium]